MKCEDHHTKKLIQVLPYNCLYLNKGNNSSVKGSILIKLIGYREFMVLIICTKNKSNLTNRYWDMVPDRQKGWTDGQTEGRTEWTDGRSQNYIPPTSSRDNKQLDVLSNILSTNKLSSKSSTPRNFLGSRSKMGVYDKEPLSCPGHSDKNIFKLAEKP